jgi:hypothetical protein
MLCSIQLRMIAGTTALTLAELEKEEGRKEKQELAPLCNWQPVPAGTTGQGCTATIVQKWTPLK